MIAGYVTLGPAGITILPRGGIGRSRTPRTSVELLLSPRLYIRADGNGGWPDPTCRSLVARIGPRRFITSEEVLTRAQQLHGGSQTVRLIPTELIYAGAQSDEPRFLATPGDGDPADAGLNRSHRRHRFRAPRRRARHVFLVLAFLLCTAAVAAFIMTGQTAQEARAVLVTSMSAVAAATGRASRVDELRQEAETMRLEIAHLDRFAFVPPATLIGAIAAGLLPAVTVQRVSVEGYRFVLEIRGSDLLPAARDLEALPMVTEVTVQSRSEGNGMVAGQIRGRLGP